jgi:hypothetical protein
MKPYIMVFPVTCVWRDEGERFLLGIGGRRAVVLPSPPLCLSVSVSVRGETVLRYFAPVLLCVAHAFEVSAAVQKLIRDHGEESSEEKERKKKADD